VYARTYLLGTAWRDPSCRNHVALAQQVGRAGLAHG